MQLSAFINFGTCSWLLTRPADNSEIGYYNYNVLGWQYRQRYCNSKQANFLAQPVVTNFSLRHYYELFIHQL